MTTKIIDCSQQGVVVMYQERCYNELTDAIFRGYPDFVVENAKLLCRVLIVIFTHSIFLGISEDGNAADSESITHWFESSIPNPIASSYLDVNTS